MGTPPISLHVNNEHASVKLLEADVGGMSNSQPCNDLQNTGHVSLVTEIT